MRRARGYRRGLQDTRQISNRSSSRSRVVLVGVCEHGHRQRSDGHREAEREDQQARQRVGEVVDLGAHAQKSREAGGGDERAEAHQRARPARWGVASLERVAETTTVSDRRAHQERGNYVQCARRRGPRVPIAAGAGAAVRGGSLLRTKSIDQSIEDTKDANSCCAVCCLHAVAAIRSRA